MAGLHYRKGENHRREPSGVSSMAEKRSHEHDANPVAV